MASLTFLRLAVVFIGILHLPSVLGKTVEEDLTLTAPEKKSLDKFKDLVLSQVDLPHEYMKNEVYLIRWLRAAYFDLFEAKRLLERNLKWRAEMKVDTIKKEDWSYYTKNFPYSLEGRDKDGKPVLYLNIGGMDLRREVVGGRINQIQRYVVKAYEETCSLVRELGEKQGNVSQAVLLLNAKGFSLVEHGCLQCVPIILNFVVTYESYFPGCADRLFLINVPAAANPIIQAARRLLHPELNKALEVYGTNRNVWQKAITKYIDLSELPPELGGSKFYKDLDFDNLDYY